RENRVRGNDGRIRRRRALCALGRRQIALTFSEIVPGCAVERAGGLGAFILGAAFAHRKRLRRALRDNDGGNCRSNKQKSVRDHWLFLTRRLLVEIIRRPKSESPRMTCIHSLPHVLIEREESGRTANDEKFSFLVRVVLRLADHVAATSARCPILPGAPRLR